MAENRTENLSRPEAAAVAFPPGLHYAYLFSVFNAFSYQVVLNSPMVLYAKNLGASATVLGIIAGMMPLLVIFQIPAASHIPRLGFKRFVYAGWGIRVMFIFAMALVPLTGIFLKPETRLALMLLLLFGFNLSRGISSCAWLPWITALVPAPLRGKYLARDAAVQNLASFLTFLLAGEVIRLTQFAEGGPRGAGSCHESGMVKQMKNAAAVAGAVVVVRRKLSGSWLGLRTCW